MRTLFCIRNCSLDDAVFCAYFAHFFFFSYSESSPAIPERGLASSRSRSTSVFAPFSWAAQWLRLEGTPGTQGLAGERAALRLRMGREPRSAPEKKKNNKKPKNLKSKLINEQAGRDATASEGERAVL